MEPIVTLVAADHEAVVVGLLTDAPETIRVVFRYQRVVRIQLVLFFRHSDDFGKFCQRLAAGWLAIVQASLLQRVLCEIHTVCWLMPIKRLVY